MENDAQPSLILVKQVLNPSVSVATVALCAMSYGYEFEGNLIVMSVILFFLVAHIMDQDFMEYRQLWKSEIKWLLGFWLHTLFWFLLRWFIVVGFVVIIASLAKVDDMYPSELLLLWLFAPPVLTATIQLLVRFLLISFQQTNSKSCSAVIVGINELSLKLDASLNQNSVLDIKIKGFFDDRALDRLAHQSKHLGKMTDLANYIKDNLINRVYITIPLSAQPRMAQLLNELRDTTASIYFIPDVFLFDLIQAKIGAFNGIPVITLCETPFSGLNGIIKRFSDIVLSSIILLVISPVMLLLALGVKLSSKGPVFFKQRRYGLDGEEIMVYKFRSMKVCEDGTVIKQATRNDPRVTRFGAFLRKSSLDELPQFINVLQGRMSIVGPRPHAVAHNEMYRKLIDGYMIRHKVKPGITGWAQINGFRGETDSIEKMQGRIEHDLEYLRNWALALDLMIILRTILIVIKDKHAY